MASRAGPTHPSRPASRHGFTIAILCALTIEANAVEALFDVHWDDDGPSFEKEPNDPNEYSTGVIGRHNVVLAHMPGMGTVSAAYVASHCRRSFPNISIGLVVGICGVVPFSAEGEIILGDVIISDGVVQYDFGRQLPGHFERKDTLLDSLGRPNIMIRAKLAKLKGLRSRKRLSGHIANHLSTLQQEPLLCAGYPGAARDKLVDATYQHADQKQTCDELGCYSSLVSRQRLQVDQVNPAPIVHFGLIASGHSVMKSGEDRDRIAKKENIIAFEMEGAGAWESFPCVVVKGACDYADSHKNKEWQRYAAATAAACMKGVLADWEPFQEGTRQSIKRWFIVPYFKNEGFVGRSSILQSLKSQLGFGSDDRTGLPQRVALHGLGGVGKTQIALDYVYWLQNTCPDVSVFWVHASTAERFQEGYSLIAEKCDIPGRDDPKADLFKIVKIWLEESYQSYWLMVIDNADDTELFFPSQHQGEASASAPADVYGRLGRYLPQCTHGSILVTSRNKQTAVRFAAGKPSIEVQRMTDEEAGELVRTIMKDNTVSRASISNLATRLEHLPLALAQATSFIQENSSTIDNYIRILDESDSILVEQLSEPFETVGRDSDTPHAVTATWIISFEQIERQHAIASSVLSMASLMDRQAIPESFISNYLRRRLSANIRDSNLAEVTKALGTLQAFSFISRGTKETVDMHRLVQLVTRKWLTMRGRMADYARDALIVVSDAFPFGSFESRELCLQYLPHANAVLANIDAKSEDEELTKASLLLNMGGLFMYQGRWREAELLFVQVMETRQRVLGEEHPDTLNSMNNLATTYRNLGRWREAESLGVQVMEIVQQVLGEGHPDTLTSMANLASTYRNLGRWREAESLGVQVMEIAQQVLGEGHPDTLTSMANLASTYRNLGRWREAESLGVQVMETRQRVLGEGHPDTLNSMNNLASTYGNLGRWREAELLFMQVIEMRQQVLGEEHPDTLNSMNNLASTYGNLGRWREAELLFVQVMETRQRVLGEGHPDTLISMNNLAFTWRKQGKIAESIELLGRCYQLRVNVLGPSHYRTMSSASTLENWKVEQENGS